VYALSIPMTPLVPHEDPEVLDENERRPEAMKYRPMLIAMIAALIVAVGSQSGASSGCNVLPSPNQLRTLLQGATNVAVFGHAGGIFDGTRMWGAVVNSDGELCAAATSTNDPRQVWPGSQAIAKSKAYTANAFNLDAGAGVPVLSTARLYTFTQPGHSLWSLGGSNTFNPRFLAEPSGAHGGEQGLVGGQIFFGGGVPLYAGGKIVGALGVSGDTSCADHEIAKRVRHLAALDPPGGTLADDISYSAPDGPSVFTHPQCLNTWRNGVKLGEELPAAGY
jgi:uncharacterized protein GlcG (DUF336 family)